MRMTVMGLRIGLVLLAWVMPILVVAVESPADSIPGVVVTRTALDVPTADTPPGTLTGRVTDVDGTPLDGVRVSARPGFNGRMSDADRDRATAVTDREGRYSLRLPYTGFQFQLSAGKEGFLSTLDAIISSTEQTVDFVLRKREPVVRPELPERFVHGVVTDTEAGVPVEGAEVVQWGREDNKRTVVTDDSGRYTLPIDGPFAICVFFAQHEDRMSSVEWAWIEDDRHVDLSLGDPGALAGRITVTGSQKPLSHCTVAIAKLTLMSGIVLEAVTDEDGYYEIGPIPPGEYEYVVGLEDNLPREVRFGCCIPSIEIEAGIVTAGDFSSGERIRIAGRVVGPQGERIAGAVIQSASTSSVLVSADNDGNFSVLLPPDTLPSLRTSSLLHGAGSCNLDTLTPSALAGEIVLSLRGITRIQGVVKGPDGEPIPGVSLLQCKTDAAGRFDTGFAPVPLSNGVFKVNVKTPRPDSGSYWTPWSENGPVTAEPTQFYHPKDFKLSARHGEAIRLEVTLDRAHQRRLQGTVRDARGEPVPDARVLLYAGMPTTSQWLGDTAPSYPSIAQRSMPGGRPAVRVAAARSDATGAWSMEMVPERDLKESGWFDEYHPNRLVAVTIDQDLSRAAMMEQVIATEQAEPTAFPLVMRPTPPEIGMRVRVVDPDGNPLPGIEWTVSTFNGPYVTGADGVVLLPRIYDRLDLKIVSEDYHIVGANSDPGAGGLDNSPNAEAPPTIPYVGQEYKFPSRIGEAKPEPGKPEPEITVQGSYVKLDFIVSEGVPVKIILESIEGAEGAQKGTVAKP